MGDSCQVIVIEHAQEIVGLDATQHVKIVAKRVATAPARQLQNTDIQNFVF